MKKKWCFNLYLLLLLVVLAGCSKEQKQDVSLEIWHYYNGAQKLAFDEFVVEFNETLGLEKGIIVEAFSQGNIGQLEERIIESAEEKVGASEIPNMVAIYSDIAYNLDQRGIIVNIEEYLKDKEIEQYIDSYIEEGRFGEDNQLKIFPTAKATEIMMVNKTDWDKFAEATGATTKDLATWEGIARTGELYYKWTDSLTEEENDGKALFGRDALANYMLVGSNQLGKDIFQIEGSQVRLNVDPDVMKKLWDNYYIPYISGYYSSYGRFSTDDAKIGEIIVLVGSTTGATYFPENVTIGNNDSYNIELLVLPLPNFQNAGLTAVQQGAGMVVLKSDQAHEKASVEFLKWFTEESRNSIFSIKTGYLPVKKAAYDLEKIEKILEKKEGEDFSQSLQMTMPIAMEQVKEYDLYISKAFKQGGQARAILESSLKEKSIADREKVLELMDKGLEHEDAVKEFSTVENFNLWLSQFQEKLLGVVQNEK